MLSKSRVHCGGGKLNITFRHNLGCPVKRTYPDEETRKRTSDTLPAADIEIWSDGCATVAIIDGGGGLLIRDIHFWYRGASYKLELLALHAALKHVESATGWTHTTTREIRCCSDSRPVVVRLQTGPSFQTTDSGIEIWNTESTLTHGNTHVTLQWVPSHCGVELSELVDELAKADTMLQ